MKTLEQLVDFSQYTDRSLKTEKNKSNIAKPFVQWVGGKKQLISEYQKYFPKEFNNYFEPFAGGGSIYFWLHSLYGDSKQYTLFDKNLELITTYNVVRDNPKELNVLLDKLSQKHSKDFYYAIRNIDRVKTGNRTYKKAGSVFDLLDDLNIAARFLYMNRTCFNAIYRVNHEGLNNVPIGKSLKREIRQERNISLCSMALQNCTVQHNDYSDVLQLAKEDDLVFLDPPYEPVSDTSNFTSYTTDNFSFEEQKKLKQVFKILSDKGVKVLLSNSNSQKIIDLYSEYKIEYFDVNRCLNSNSTKRKKSATEILVIGF